MKIAFIYTGMFRNFPKTVENHIEFLFSHYDSDIYLNLWDVYGHYAGYKVNKELNPRYHNLINKWYEKTNVPILLNTSFNDREPIVEPHRTR